MTIFEHPNVEPDLISMTDGSWLAVAPPGFPFRAGAVGNTQQEATIAFGTAVERISEALASDP